MDGEKAFYIILTNRQDPDLRLRRVAWHELSTRFRQRWPNFQGATVYEYSPKRGAHLNIVVKNTPGLTREYVKHIVDLVADGTKLGWFTPVYNARRLASYITKQLGNKAVMNGWPRHFHAVSTTQGWCPDWMTDKEWSDHYSNLKTPTHD